MPSREFKIESRGLTIELCKETSHGQANFARDNAVYAIRIDAA